MNEEAKRLGPPPGFGIDPETEALRRDLQLDLERSRLEQRVIKVAKEWRELRLGQAGTRRTLAELMDALDDLVYFESSQG